MNGRHATPDELLQAALAYADRGWRVVPLHDLAGGKCSCGRDCGSSAGKHPRVKDWPNSASNDVSVVAAWWAKWPHANVGFALGTASGVVAVDVDSEAGEELLRALAGGEPEATLEYRTGKGRRLLYAIPDSLETEPQTHAVQGPDGTEAVRFQGKGGQCVLPPSRHYSGKAYSWVVDPSAEPTPMPDWLLTRMLPAKPAAAAPPSDPNAPQFADAGARDAFREGATFNERANWWADILAPNGFTKAGQDDRGVDRYTRPGKDGGVSVTVGHYVAKDGTPGLYVFSGSVPQLAAGKCYDKFGAFARLFHSGDFRRAAQDLAKRGYGIPSRPSASGVQAPPAEPVEWGDPIPLDDPSPTMPAFPLSVFPRALQDLVAGSAEAVGCPVDYPAAHALAVAAGAIGASYDLQVKRGFYAPSNLWVCVVAPPGSGKSPGVGPVLAPVYERQARLAREEKKQPAFVSDVTVERLARLLDENPRGLLMVWDEMAGWLTSFNQYKAGGKGSDRSHYLSIWDGRALRVDRSAPDKPPVFVRRPRLSVVGGIQPEVLDELRAGPSDGLFDRLLFSYPADPGLVVEQFAEPDEPAERAWRKALDDLWGRELKKEADGDERPSAVVLSDDGRPVWRDWTQELATRAAEPDAPSYYRAVAAKAQGYAARLALVAHLLREAYSETHAMGVGADDMRRGVTLAEYFLAHAERVRRTAGRDERLGRARAISRWAAGYKAQRFTRSDAWQSMRRNSAFTKAEDLGEPMRLLMLHRHLRWSDEGKCYEVNPALLGEAGRSDRDR